ncbi:sialidase family protein [Algoriphagus sp. CAU 1675]|uniref:sialidase family protein n=1 Tax=Algoriphagus sp. CAU 1675 TaxID=3032597 RepID=UPI0023DA7AE6|nr:sialidase family protein [Algoriphagus sp. CAU 1675]MDF2157266.1 sialidase family protein [Algoriphagus sp. CAU 1675]
MKKFSTVFLFSFLSFFAFAQESLVFKGGTEGHAIYRIPAIISLPSGELLAFAEGRVNGSDDFGDVNLVMKKSEDQGLTWSPLQTLIDYDTLQAGNPAPVVDLHDPNYPNGVVYLFYNTGNNHEYDIRMNRGVREVWMLKSFDLGKSWEAPVNITKQVHLPNNPEFNPSYTNPQDWRHYANTPGHAFQFQGGKFKGRIYVAANHSSGNPQDQFAEYQAHGFYSDDHGKTFHLSESIEIPGSNESIAAELSQDRMIMSIRNQKGDIRSRILAYSSDGGQTWDEAYFEEQLPDPVCQASILNIGERKGKTILAHSNASHPDQRNNLCIKISFDEGKTWDRTIAIDKTENPEQKAWTAYSDLVQLESDTLGILYERNNYSEIVFKQIRWDNLP